MTNLASRRLNFRVRPDQEERLRAAAEIAHESLTDFVIRAAEERADALLETHTSVSPDFFAQMLAAMDRPPQVLPRLADAARRSRRVSHS
jgi:uncharacterized protein (DUF1778 family)